MNVREPFYLGVDGGGTGCRARLETRDGRVLGHGTAGPATLRLGLDTAWASIMAAGTAAMIEAGLAAHDRPLIHMAVGLAGLGRVGMFEQLKGLPHGFASIRFVSDGTAACLGAHSGRDGAIVIAGTGSIGLGRVDGRDIRVGGYGFPASDEGSGADIGLQAIKLALKAHDGRLPQTPLLAAIMQRFESDPASVIAWMDRATATDYATFAPVVLHHAAQGDEAAQRVTGAAAKEIEGLVDALIGAGAPRVSLLGGLAASIERWLSSHVRQQLKPADGDAISGAIILAKRAVVAD